MFVDIVLGITALGVSASMWTVHVRRLRRSRMTAGYARVGADLRPPYPFSARF